MKRIFFYLAFLFFVSVFSQEINDTLHDKSVPGKWHVNKTFDENGNLVQYDSIYSWSYSSANGEKAKVNIDSIMKDFKTKSMHQFSWKPDFNLFPEPDSLFKSKFFNQHYFFDSWQDEMKAFQKMLQKVDSSRNMYLEKHYPGLLESKKKKTI